MTRRSASERRSSRVEGGMDLCSAPDAPRRQGRARGVAPSGAATRGRQDAPWPPPWLRLRHASTLYPQSSRDWIEDRSPVDLLELPQVLPAPLPRPRRRRQPREEPQAAWAAETNCVSPCSRRRPSSGQHSAPWPSARPRSHRPTASRRRRGRMGLTRPLTRTSFRRSRTVACQATGQLSRPGQGRAIPGEEARLCCAGALFVQVWVSGGLPIPQRHSVRRGRYYNPVLVPVSLN